MKKQKTRAEIMSRLGMVGWGFFALAWVYFDSWRFWIFNSIALIMFLLDWGYSR